MPSSASSGASERVKVRTKGRSTALGLRAWLVRLHRWAGLLMAGFLFVAGVTGAVISILAGAGACATGAVIAIFRSPLFFPKM